MVTVAESLVAIEAERAEAEARRARKPARHDKARFYSSSAWRALRYRALRENRESYGVLTCEVCKATAGPFHVDHIVPLSKDWTRRLDITNTQCMCRDCNEGKSATDAIDWRPAAAA